MTTTVYQPTAVLQSHKTKRSPLPYFSGAGATEALQAVNHLGFAQNLQKGVNFIARGKDIRKGGLSLEDIAARLQTAIGVYLLQGYYSVKDSKHPWETNGRNALVWLMTLGVTWWSKSDSVGVNPMVFNTFMKQKGSAAKLFQVPIPRELVDWARMDTDYLDILQKAGLLKPNEVKDAAENGKSLWTASWLDVNKIEKIQNYGKKLEEQLLELAPDRVKTVFQQYKKGKVSASAFKKEMRQFLETLKASGRTEEREMAKMYQAIPNFFKRINIFNVSSTALVMAATVYLIGVVAMRIVNKFISPLDKDYDGKTQSAKAKPGSDNSHLAQPHFAMRQPPQQFSSFSYGATLPAQPTPFLYTSPGYQLPHNQRGFNG